MKVTPSNKRHLASNGFVLLAILANVINLFLYWEEGISQAVRLELAGIGMLVVCIILNGLGYFNYSKIVSAIAVNGQMFLLSKLLGTSSCNYLYLFPYAISMLFFLRGNNYGLRAYMPTVLTVINFVCILYFCDVEATMIRDHYHFKEHLTLNIAFNFFLVIVFCYMMFKNIRARERKLKDANTQLEKAIQVKSRFLSSMSHELRTPLNGIIASLDIMESEKPERRNDEYFEIVRYSSTHMLDIVNQILEYSKFESKGVQINKEPVNLKEIANILIHLFHVEAQKKDIGFELSISEDFPSTVLTDKVRIEQVLINCISNAIKFSSGGNVIIQMGTKPAEGHQKKIEIIIADQGVGVKKEMLESVFESFVQEDTDTTRRFGGTGLGLSICKQIMTALEGTIILEQNQPVGTIVKLNFPAAIVAAEKPSKDERLGVYKFNGLKVILVEDNNINRLVADNMLKKWGCLVTQAINGLEGLQRFKESAFDIAIIDLEMPEMDGRDLVKAIKAINPALPCLAFSAANYDNMLQELTSFGFDDFVPKPFNPKDLNEKILKLVRSK